MSTTVALTFANRPYDPEAIELVHAWDVAAVEDNPTGYEETKHGALAAMGTDLLHWVTVEVEVPDDSIRNILSGVLPTIEPTMTEVTESSES